MSTTLTTLHALSTCDFHFCIYAGFGVGAILRAAQLWRLGDHDHARENLAHGLVYMALSLLK